LIASREVEAVSARPQRAEAAVKLQRWYRSRCRRQRFRALLLRAIQRRKYLEDRRRIARRIATNEYESREISVRLQRPTGVQLLERWRGTRETTAAQKLQSLWRGARQRKRSLSAAVEQKRDAAARKLQAFARQWRHRGAQRPLAQAARASPCAVPLDSVQLQLHETSILEAFRDRRQEYLTRCRGMPFDAIKHEASQRYREFATSTQRALYDVWRVTLQREQTRRMGNALDHRGWGNPVPYGVCSAMFLREAEEKHLERKASLEASYGLFGGAAGLAGSPGMPPLVESQAEEAEADELLRSLETELGYDFRLAGER